METNKVVWMCLPFNQGVNSSCHVQTTVSVERGIIWGIIFYSLHKGDVISPPPIVYILKEVLNVLEFWSLCTKGAPKILDLDFFICYFF
jgi:hypothetical protein